jgi:hypothetical protein
LSVLTVTVHAMEEHTEADHFKKLGHTREDLERSLAGFKELLAKVQ